MLCQSHKKLQRLFLNLTLLSTWLRQVWCLITQSCSTMQASNKYIIGLQSIISPSMYYSRLCHIYIYGWRLVCEVQIHSWVYFIWTHFAIVYTLNILFYLCCHLNIFVQSSLVIVQCTDLLVCTWHWMSLISTVLLFSRLHWPISANTTINKALLKCTQHQ